MNILLVLLFSPKKLKFKKQIVTTIFFFFLPEKTSRVEIKICKIKDGAVF